MNIFTLFNLFTSKKKARKQKGWLKYFPSVSKLFSLQTIQDTVMDELSPLLKMIFPKTEENVYRTITLVAIINACFAALPGKMGIGVYVSVALEIAMAVGIANHVGLHEIRKENIFKYFGTLATVGFAILVLFKEAISVTFSLFSSFTGPLNPMIPAELLVTNLYGIMFLVGFKEMKKTGSFKIPLNTFGEIYKTTKELTAHQWKFIKKKPIGLLKKCGKKVYAFVTGDVSIKNLNQSEIRGDVFPILATAHLLDNNFESLKGPMGQMFLKAVRLSFPEQLSPNASPSEIAEHLRGYTPEQLHGLINKNIKGKMFEVIMDTRENADGDNWTAKPHPNISHPGSDSTFINEKTGEIIEVQYKSTFNTNYVETEMAKNPDTVFIVSDEVAQKINDPRVVPAGMTNEDITNTARDKAQQLMKGEIETSELALGAMYGGMASGIFQIFPYVMAYKKNKITKEELEKVLETLLPQAGEKTIQFMVKYSLGGMLYLWWRPANLILSSLYEDEVEVEKKTKKEKKYSRREILTLSFLPILK